MYDDLVAFFDYYGKLNNKKGVKMGKRKTIKQSLREALEEIRDRAATMKNGGAWAAGIALLCLGTLD